VKAGLFQVAAAILSVNQGCRRRPLFQIRQLLMLLLGMWLVLEAKQVVGRGAEEYLGGIGVYGNLEFGVAVLVGAGVIRCVCGQWSQNGDCQCHG
jgi:hypothetical protein